MQRHNISHIFVMTEQYEEDRTADLNVNYIFKYTSIKEIFNEITGKSADVLKISMSLKQDMLKGFKDIYDAVDGDSAKKLYETVSDAVSGDKKNK